MSYFGKVFEPRSSVHNDAFNQSLGLPADVLGMFSNFKSQQKIEKSGDNYIYTYVTPKGDMSLPFISGVEFEDKVRDITIKNTFTVDGNCVTHVMKFDSGLIVTSKKQFSENKIVEEQTNSNWDGVAYVTYEA